MPVCKGRFTEEAYPDETGGELRKKAEANVGALPEGAVTAFSGRPFPEESRERKKQAGMGSVFKGSFRSKNTYRGCPLSGPAGSAAGNGSFRGQSGGKVLSGGQGGESFLFETVVRTGPKLCGIRGFPFGPRALVGRSGPGPAAF